MTNDDLIKKFDFKISEVLTLSATVFDDWYYCAADHEIDIDCKWKIWCSLLGSNILSCCEHLSDIKLEVPVLNERVTYGLNDLGFNKGEVFSPLGLYEAVIRQLNNKELTYKERDVKAWIIDWFWNTKAIVYVR